MKQITDEWLVKLYRKLVINGWADPWPLPHSTRDSDRMVKKLTYVIDLPSKDAL